MENNGQSDHIYGINLYFCGRNPIHCANKQAMRDRLEAHRRGENSELRKFSTELLLSKRLFCPFQVTIFTPQSDDSAPSKWPSCDEMWRRNMGFICTSDFRALCFTSPCTTLTGKMYRRIILIAPLSRAFCKH